MPSLVAYLWRDFAHANQTLHANHPVSAFLHLLPLDLYLHPGRRIILFQLQCLCNTVEFFNGVLSNEILIIQMIKENVQSLLCVLDLRSERRRSFTSDSLHVSSEYAHHLLSYCRYM